MTATRIETDIAVVGGGPVGLAAALAASHAGYRTMLIAPRAPADRRTSALLAGSISLLEALDVWPRLNAKAAPLRTIRIVDATKRLVRAPEVSFDAAEIGLTAFGSNIPNIDLVTELNDALADRGVTRVEALVETAHPGVDSVVLVASTGARIEAKLAVAADGRRSRLRDAAEIPVETWTYDQAALVCNIHHQRPHDDTSTEFHTEHGPFTLVPLGERRSSLVWVDVPGETERRKALTDDALAAEIEVRSESILGAITVDGPRQVFPLAGLTASAFGAKRTVLAGEAAHLFPPIGAQGLNLGYRDVAALRELLNDTPADPGAANIVADYDRSRRADVLSRSVAVDALNRTLLSDFLPAQILRGLGLFLVDRVPALRKLAMQQGLAV